MKRWLAFSPDALNVQRGMWQRVLSASGSSGPQEYLPVRKLRVPEHVCRKQVSGQTRKKVSQCELGAKTWCWCDLQPRRKLPGGFLSIGGCWWFQQEHRSALHSGPTVLSHCTVLWPALASLGLHLSFSGRGVLHSGQLARSRRAGGGNPVLSSCVGSPTCPPLLLLLYCCCTDMWRGEEVHPGRSHVFWYPTC